MSKPNKPRYIVVHTAAFKGDADIKKVDHWHATLKPKPFKRQAEWVEQWNPELKSIGYHYFIRRDGSIQTGRHEEEPGSHCSNDNMNFKSIGICCEGHGDHDDFTDDQYDSLFELARRLRGRYPDITRGGTAALVGHREVRGVKKTCPGTQVDMDEMRDRYRVRVISDSMGAVEALGLQPFPV